jgi:hypothetical protein
LRQAAAASASAAYLFQPQTAIRVRWNMNVDTELAPDEPAGENPPDGAMIDYYLAAGAGAVTLEIRDAAGALVRRYSSGGPTPPVDPDIDIPTFWLRPPHPLSNAAGMHRFLWDMHYTPLNTGAPTEYPMQALFQNTVPSDMSIWAKPGQYTVKLTVDGKNYTQPMLVKMDPRVKTPPAGLDQQFRLSRQLYDDLVAAGRAPVEVRAVREQLARLGAQAKGPLANAVIQWNKQTDPFQDAITNLTTLIQFLEAADVTPTAQMAAAVVEQHAAFTRLMPRWNTLKTTDLAAWNEQLKQAGLPELTP